MTEIALSFFIGFLVGLVMRPKDKDIKEQTDIYNRKCQEYEETIQYYKDLCKWHVEQRKDYGQTKGN